MKVDDDTRFKVVFPLYALEAFKESNVEPFDVLVVDECQDLLIPEYLPIFDKLVAGGGLKKGHWAFWGDMDFRIFLTRHLLPNK